MVPDIRERPGCCGVNTQLPRSCLLQPVVHQVQEKTSSCPGHSLSLKLHSGSASSISISIRSCCSALHLPPLSQRENLLKRKVKSQPCINPQTQRFCSNHISFFLLLYQNRAWPGAIMFLLDVVAQRHHRQLYLAIPTAPQKVFLKSGKRFGVSPQNC